MHPCGLIVALLVAPSTSQADIADGAALMRASLTSEYGNAVKGTEAQAVAAAAVALSAGTTGLTVEVLPSRSLANAFACPDGTVLITRGLVEECGSDDELAFVVAHEAAHVLLGHAARAAQAALAELACWALVGDCGAEWHRSTAGEEREADTLSADLLERAGYDPLAGVRLLTRLATVGRGHAVCARPPEW